MAVREISVSENPRAAWLIRLGDNALILGHRLSEWCSHAPMLEEDIAVSNLALDLIGQARAFYQHACLLENTGRSEDDLAYRRSEHEFRNVLLVEQPNGNFADTIARQLIFASFALPLYEALSKSNDDIVASIAVRAAREMSYHLRHAGNWLVRLGDGTELSNSRAQNALNELWPHVNELFVADELDAKMEVDGFGVNLLALRAAFDANIKSFIAQATLSIPETAPDFGGGKRGYHTEHLSYLLAELQFLPRTYPDAVW